MEFYGLTRLAAYRQAREFLEQREIGEADREAKLIISGGIQGEISEIFLYADTALTKRQARKIELVLARRISGMPLQYAMRLAYFMGLKFYVDKRVLIPRPETELLTEHVLRFIAQGKSSVLDLCTGSGCIAISIAVLQPNADITATDKYASALAVAKKNAVMNGVADRIKFVKSDMFESIEGKFDCIVSNPPYISEKEYDELDAAVRCYEPRAALLAGDGLKFYRVIAEEAKNHLETGGRLLLEIGYNEAKGVTQLLEAYGYSGIQCEKDYSGQDRIISAKVT